jgi:Cytochrome P460
MKSKEGWFFIIPILFYCLWLVYVILSPPVNPGIFTQITGAFEPPLDDSIFPVLRYRQLELVTSEPYLISPEMWLLCTTPSLQEEALLESEHAGLAVRLYANEEALPILEEWEGRIFPKGTILVKEKLLTPESTEAVALGMMIKTESGFNRNGVWEFAYWSQEGGLIQGEENLSTCIKCHSAQATTDMVFWEE